MKKIFAILTVAAMLLTLAACGNNGSSSNTTTKKDDGTTSTSSSAQETNSPDTSVDNTDNIDINGILSGDGAVDVIYANLSAAQKQTLIDEAKAEGVEVTFNADGSTTFTDTDGSVMTQNSDGTWSYKDAEGGETQLGGNWPDNEYTKLIPKPDFSITALAAEENHFTAVFSGVEADKLKAYVEQVKAFGFTVNAETIDEEYAGVSVYSYEASNSSGYVINITLSGGACSLTIDKP